MKNTEYLFRGVTDFMTKRLELYDEYMARMKELESKKGSDYYRQEALAARRKREAGERSARAKAAQVIDSTYGVMQRVNRRRQIQPISQDQLNILQALKLRNNVSDDELLAIANTLAPNGLALGALTEYAQDMYTRRQEKSGSNIPHVTGFAPNFMHLAAGNWPISTIDRAIDDIIYNCRKILHDKSGGANYVRALGAEIHQRQHDPAGVVNYDALPREHIPESEAEFYNSMSSVDFPVISACVNE